ANVRMRPHVDALAGTEFGRSHVIEEDEWSDHAALRRGQRAPHREPTEVAGARDDHALDRVARIGIARHGVLAGKEAHGSSLTRYRHNIDVLRSLLQTGPV